MRRSAKEVSEQWSLCLRRAGNVKVKRAYALDGEGVDSIATEVLKYSVKGSELVEFDGNPGIVIDEMEKTRLLTSFGSCFGHLKEHDEVRDPLACENCGEFGQFVPDSDLDELMRKGGKSRFRK